MMLDLVTKRERGAVREVVALFVEGCFKLFPLR